jgi:deoxycytidine triphosphate deaminase
MLSGEEIRTGLQSGTFGLRYYFVPSSVGNNYVQLAEPAPPYGENQAAHNLFEESLVRNRIALSLGPLLKPLVTTGTVLKSMRFGGHKSVVDLRRCPDGWPLAPGESVVTFTNEWLRLPGNLVGFIVSRVAHYENGLLVAASHVDSTWEGIVKLHLTNFSGRTVHLRLGAELARLFLFKTEDQSVDDHAVPRHEIHYGLTWPRVLGDEIDPFSHSSSRTVSFRVARLRNTNELLKNYAGYGLLTLLIAGLGAGMNLYTKVSEPLELPPKVAAVASDVNRLKEDAIQSGVESVLIRAGSASAKGEIELPAGFTNSPSFISAQGRNTTKEVVVTPTLQRRSGKQFLVVSVVLPQAVHADTDIDVQWLVAP